MKKIAKVLILVTAKKNEGAKQKPKKSAKYSEKQLQQLKDKQQKN